MNAPTDHSRNSAFGLGLLIGACVGAGLAVWFAPRTAAELRERAAESVDRLKRNASERYRQAAARVDEAVDQIARKGRDLRDEASEAVEQGAHIVERVATAIKS